MKTRPGIPVAKQNPYQQAKDWNEWNPAGTKVLYHPVIGEPQKVSAVTEGLAFVIGGHTAAVKLAGRSGSVALAALEVEA